MLAFSFTDARANLKAVMDRVVTDRAPVIITRQRGEAAVLISQSEWEATEKDSWTTQKRCMSDLTDAEIDAAAGRGEAQLCIEPRARAAHYDAAADRIVVELTSGATYSFSPWLAQGLRGASAAEMAEVEVLGAGFGLHWEGLDADCSVPGLLKGVFGTARWMDELRLAEAAE